jgi:hypothetical protein
MPTIDITAGELPPPQCYASEQDRLEAYAAALIGNLNTGAEWVTSQTAPGNTALYWLRTDSSDRPIDVMKWSGNPVDLAWIRSSSEVVFAGTATGAGGNYAVTNSPAYPNAASAYRTGQIYTFLANHTNAGACTLNVDGKGAKTITKDGLSALTANDILVGQVVTVLYDGVNFQLITQKRDLTRISLKQFLTYESAIQAIPADGTALLFPHGFSNPSTGLGIIPFMVRTVIKRTATGSVAWTNASGKVFTWYSGEEIDAAMMVHQGGVPNGAPNFLTVANASNVNVWCQLPTLAPPANDLFPTLFFVSAFMVPADYGIKVYATALNPLYTPP